MRNKDLIQRAIHSCMNRIGLPYNGALKGWFYYVERV